MAVASKTLWMTPKKAAAYLGVELKALWAYETAGLLRAVAPNGRGPGKRVYFHREDVEEFAKTGICKRVRKPHEFSTASRS